MTVPREGYRNTTCINLPLPMSMSDVGQVGSVVGVGVSVCR
jgi:hypothetical protein